jgi:hypothetical protein
MSSMLPMVLATKASARAGMASRTLPPAVATPPPGVVPPLEVPDPTAVVGRGCVVPIGAVGTTGICERKKERESVGQPW